MLMSIWDCLAKERLSIKNWQAKDLADDEHSFSPNRGHDFCRLSAKSSQHAKPNYSLGTLTEKV
jgi:hypothetical protein